MMYNIRLIKIFLVCAIGIICNKLSDMWHQLCENLCKHAIDMWHLLCNLCAGSLGHLEEM